MDTRFISPMLTPIDYKKQWRLASARIICLLGLFFAGLSIAGLCSAIFAALLPGRTGFLASSLTQNIFAFLLPAMSTAIIVCATPWRLLGLDRVPSLRALAGMLLLYMAALPLIDQTIAWNEAIRFPQSLSGIVQSLREMENEALRISNTILNVDSTWGLLSGLLFVGIATGFCEEIFFRGALQRMLMCRRIGAHASVWISAFIFSLLHFQFFGFLPRLLIGAMFGYLFLWSGSLILNAIAHALNNSIVVVSYWLTNRGTDMSELDKFGVTDGFPWPALLSFVAVIAIAVCLRSVLFTSCPIKKS